MKIFFSTPCDVTTNGTLYCDKVEEKNVTTQKQTYEEQT